MTVPHTSTAKGAAAWSAAATAPAAGTAAARPVRRLPVHKDWPAGAIVATQIGILVVIIALWEIAADLGWIDAFFWSQPSAIYRTLIIFFTKATPSPNRLHLPLDDPRLRDRHHGGLGDRLVVLVVAQLCGDRAALHHLLRVDAEARARAADHAGVRHRHRLQGRDRDGADARGLDAHQLCRRQGGRSRRREAVLFARRTRCKCSASWSSRHACRGSSRCCGSTSGSR